MSKLMQTKFFNETPGNRFIWANTLNTLDKWFG